DRPAHARHVVRSIAETSHRAGAEPGRGGSYHARGIAVSETSGVGCVKRTSNPWCVPRTLQRVITMRFVLFIIANALLFIRPSELIAELAAVEIYRWFILACLAVSLPVVFQQVS